MLVKLSALCITDAMKANTSQLASLAQRLLTIYSTVQANLSHTCTGGEMKPAASQGFIPAASGPSRTAGALDCSSSKGHTPKDVVEACSTGPKILKRSTWRLPLMVLRDASRSTSPGQNKYEIEHLRRDRTPANQSFFHKCMWLMHTYVVACPGRKQVK